ncbi:MAG: iron-sulfur cluster assembly scaffold protein [Pseudomonadota bacterium]
MNAPLYTTEILRLAVDAANYPRLFTPHASDEARTPICGSRITVDVEVDLAGRICAVGMDVHACAMGQASAALFAGGVYGRTSDEIEGAATALGEWLSGESDMPPDWPGVAALAPAIPHSARHAAILLPFRAGAAAAKRANMREGGQAA